MKVNGKKLKMVRGDSEAITVKLTNAAGELMPLVPGDTVYFTVKDSAYTEVKLLQVVVTEFEEGVALITIRPEDTKQLPFREYVYDVQVTFENGAAKTVIPKSSFVVAEEVTYE